MCRLTLVLLCVLASFLCPLFVTSIPVIPSYLPALILPEFSMHLPYYARLFSAMTNQTNLSYNETSIDRMTHLYETILNQTKSLEKQEKTRQDDALILAPKSSPGSQLKLINDRIILLLVFNNLLLDLIANLEESQKELKDKLLQKITSTRVAKGHYQQQQQLYRQTISSEHQRHHAEMIPMSSNAIESSSSSLLPAAAALVAPNGAISVTTDSSKVTTDAAAAGATTARPTQLPQLKRKFSVKTSAIIPTKQAMGFQQTNAHQLSPPITLMKGGDTLLGTSNKRTYSKMTNSVVNRLSNEIDHHQPVKPPLAAPLAKVKNERVIYITDSNELIGPELRSYIETMGDQKRLKVVFTKSTSDQFEPDKARPELDNHLYNNRIFEETPDADWKPKWPTEHHWIIRTDLNRLKWNHKSV